MGSMIMGELKKESLDMGIIAFVLGFFIITQAEAVQEFGNIQMATEIIR